MNYKHIYHAGNFADVAKHVGLLFCLEALKRKEAPFFALDSHAGRGQYELQAVEAQKSGEAERGIQRLIATSIGEESLAGYFAAIRARRGKRLNTSPGSPGLIAGALRPQDRALFVELMPAEARAATRENQLARAAAHADRRWLCRTQGVPASRGAPRSGAHRPAVRKHG